MNRDQQQYIAQDCAMKSGGECTCGKFRISLR